MTPEEINIAIAEACGWIKCRLVIKGAGGGTRKPTAHGFPPNRSYEAACPNFTYDLNAMHEAWKTLNHQQKLEYRQHLKGIGVREYLRRQDVWMEEIEAEFGPEAFLKTLGLWKP